MALGYDGKLYILAFDHRGSFQKKMFGIEGDPTPDETKIIVDEQFGGTIPETAKKHGLSLTMPAEKSGVNEFQFEFGEDFPAHIEKYDLLATKVLVRYNPDGDAEMNERQTKRLKELADWLHANGKKFLFELLVPAEPAQLESVGGDTDRYDAELRPELMRRVIEHFQNEGVEVDVWKIEGVDTQEDAQMLADQTRKGEGRENVKSVLLGRGASNEKVDQWLQAAAPVEGFIGFAIGRSIWWDPLKAYLDGGDREEQAQKIADNYLSFIKVYDEAASSVN